MLVSRNRFILKTCGTTTLLHAIKPLMSLVQEIYPGATVMVRGEEEEEGAEEKEGWKGRLREGGGNLGDHERKLGLGWEWKVKGVEVVGG